MEEYAVVVEAPVEILDDLVKHGLSEAVAMRYACIEKTGHEPAKIIFDMPKCNLFGIPVEWRNAK